MGKALFFEFVLEFYFGRLAVVLYWPLNFGIFLLTHIQLFHQFGEPFGNFLV
jgi:hypothetical protein|tara:strand:+ start:71 stop:226 length:156 start_codon:yes stop_codon:yes gene_type:complete